METHNFFTDDNGTRFDLESDVYNPRSREVNNIIRRSVGRQIVAGSFRDF